MNANELKNKITAANAAYRSGAPVMTDAEYDALLEEYEKSVSPTEYSEFRDTLNEGATGTGKKVRHPYVMGSLDKIKNSDPDALSKFVREHVRGKLSVSAKVDGISCRVRYVDGVLSEAATRGDGSEGVDITEKIRFVNFVPHSIPAAGTVEVRGELVIFKGVDLDSDKNPRNVCAGLFNRKDVDEKTLRKTSFVAYTVLGGKYTKAEQFELLDKCGFKTAWHESVDASEVDCARLTETAKLEHEYECDGLVLVGENEHNEEAYRPKNAMAFKINELVAESTIVDVSWDGPSEYGFFCPVAVIEPVELGGATISLASMHNLDVMESLGAMYGSRIEVVKANDIIPQISKVLPRTDDAGVRPIELPTECPCCGTSLVRDGVNMRCPNAECPDQKVRKIEHFIKKLGVMNASFKTLAKFGVTSYESILFFKADKGKKSETKFESELAAKMFSKSPDTLFCALSIEGLGETLQRKIVERYGWDAVKAGRFEGPLPAGIGEITLDKFKTAYAKNLEFVEKIMADTRYSYVEGKAAPKAKTKVGSVCFTGSLNTMTRTQASEMAAAAGFEVKSGVSKGLTYLVTNDKNSGSSKNRKAAELGTKIIDETEFVSIMRGNTVESDVMSM